MTTHKRAVRFIEREITKSFKVSLGAVQVSSFPYIAQFSVCAVDSTTLCPPIGYPGAIRSVCQALDVYAPGVVIECDFKKSESGKTDGCNVFSPKARDPRTEFNRWTHLHVNA